MLNKEQIQKIDAFFNENGVQYYDVRQELIDHVSEIMEQKMNSNPSLPFEVAFDETVARFSKKELVLLNEAAGSNYDPRKEWQYFTKQRILKFLLIYLAMALPLYYLPSRPALLTGALYFVLWMVFNGRMLLAFRKRHPAPCKKLNTFSHPSWFITLLPVLYQTYIIGKYMLKINTETQVHPVTLALLPFFMLFATSAQMAQQHLKEQDYLAAKNNYPFLF
ncbi:hypothetical protein LQ567_15630 [Niabella pedocola]|uniref:Uncharacterized protein n=1 Tax=Niabella pedocola TaxID=1752077 RepID=A0ABS8PT02_9BACT|nr:hypothetical protein [Niabella pedocola]MCD2424211.1 hypothetical protein [Niabella pedocola]